MLFVSFLDGGHVIGCERSHANDVPIFASRCARAQLPVCEAGDVGDDRSQRRVFSHGKAFQSRGVAPREKSPKHRLLAAEFLSIVTERKVCHGISSGTLHQRLEVEGQHRSEPGEPQRHTSPGARYSDELVTHFCDIRDQQLAPVMLPERHVPGRAMSYKNVTP